MQHSVCNFTLCILRRVSEFLAESFDILLMGDMFFDENLGGKLSNLARTFKETCPKSKMVLIGDPGRWLLSEQKNRVFQSTLIWKVQAFSLHSWFFLFGSLTSFGALLSCKVQRADLTCNVIRKVASFVLSKLWILVADG